MIAVPNVGGVHPDVHRQVQMMVADRRITGTGGIGPADYDEPIGRPIENNRNQIARHVINAKYDYLITIDSDNPPVRSVVDLVFLDKPVIACPTPICMAIGKPGARPFSWNCLDGEPGDYREHTPCEGLQQIDAAGTGCMVIQRAALEAVEAPFSSIYSEHGILTLGTDLAFCLRLKREAIPIYAHYDYPCRHHHGIDLYELAVAWDGYRADNPHLVRIRASPDPTREEVKPRE